MPTFEAKSILPASASEVFAWHTRDGALTRLMPVWDPARVEAQVGDFPERCLKLKIPMGPFSATWLAQHSDYVEGKSFRDTQVAGPFSKWVHDHIVEPIDADHASLTDRIEYNPPLGGLGRMLAGKAIDRKLRAVFTYRHKIMHRDLTRHGLTPTSMRGSTIAITGASGMLGRALAAFFSTGGHKVIRIGRGRDSDLVWKPEQDGLGLERGVLEGVSCVIHLAGDNVGEGRWTGEKKKRIRESRVPVTHRLAVLLSGLVRKPESFITASGIGYYGDRGQEILTESSSIGEGFLSGVCREWEQAARLVEPAGIRCVNVRLGVVLSPLGGALARMLPLFKLGLGGRIGSGRQVWSWVSLEDVIGLFHHAMITQTVNGPMNATAPEPMICQEFARELGYVLGRPAVLPAPEFAIRMALGEAAGPLVLSSTLALPERALTSGYTFVHPGLRDAFQEMLGMEGEERVDGRE